MKPVIINSVPTGPCVGDIDVTDSTMHVVVRNRPGVDDVGTVSPHELALMAVDEHDGLGIGTKHKDEKILSIF